MNKTIIININSIVFHIEEDAYDTLRKYMIEIKKHFGSSEDSSEILEDIENRIAEMFSEKIHQGQKEVINTDDVEEVIRRMGRVDDFMDFTDETQTNFGSYDETKSTEAPTEPVDKKLMRDSEDKILGGVCSGLAHYFNMEARWIRVLFILFVMLGGSGILLYALLWIVLPKAVTRADKMAMRGEAVTLQNFKKSFDEEMNHIKENFSTPESAFRKGADGLTRFFERLFKFIGLILLVGTTVILGLTLIGLIIGFVAFSLGLVGVFEEPVFPPIKLLSEGQAPIALFFGFSSIIIPFFALFYLFVRILFKQKPMNNFLSLALFSVWIISIIGIIYFVSIVNLDFKEQSTIKVEEVLKPEHLYFFEFNDIRVIEGKDSSQLKFNFENKNLRDYLRSNINISFESIDSLSAPYIQYNYSAKGDTYQKAADRASKIDYTAVQKEDKIYFNSHFTLSPQELERNQKVEVVVHLPIGTEAYIHSALRNKLKNISYKGCNTEFSEKRNYTKWKMSSTGLECLNSSQEKIEI